MGRRLLRRNLCPQTVEEAVGMEGMEETTEEEQRHKEKTTTNFLFGVRGQANDATSVTSARKVRNLAFFVYSRIMSMAFKWTKTPHKHEKSCKRPTISVRMSP